MRYWDKARQAGKGTRLLVQYIAQIVQAGQAFKRGEYRRALEAATRASAAAQDMTTAINELIGGGFDDNALVAQGQRVLGQLHYALGNFTEAIPLLEQSIDLQRKMGKDSGPEYAKALSGLALIYVAMGTHERAIDLLQQALRAMEATVQQTSQVFGKLGGLTDIMMDVDWGVATTRNNLAIVYAAIGDHAAALDLLGQAQQAYQATGGTQHQDYARTLNNIGAIQAFLGDTEGAGSAFKEASDIYKSVGLVDHPDSAQLMGNWAELLRRAGEYVTAMSLSAVALTSLIRSVGVGHPAVADQMLILARTATVTGAPEAAMKSLEAAEIINDQMMGQVFAAGSEAQRKDFVAQIRLFFATFLSVIQRHPGVPSAAQSGMGLVLKRKGILAEALAVQRDAVLYGRHPALEPALREWQSLRVRIGGKTLAGPGPEGSERHQQILAEWQAQRDRLEATLARQIPEMNLAQRLRTVDRQVVAAALPAGSVLVEFARVPIFDFAALAARGDPEWAPDRYLALIMAAGEPDGVQMVDLGEAAPIDQQITAYRAAITGEDPDGDALQRREGGASSTETDTSDRRAGILRAAEYLASDPREPSATTGLDRGRVLRALLFDPLVAALGGRTRLFLAPDGDLARLPFEVLPLEDDRFLIDAYHISYLGAGRDILRYGTASDRQAAPPMIVADPDYDLASETKPHPASGVPFRRLIGARLEAATVASLLNVEPLVDTEALETTLKLCRSPRILHVATHGFFLPDGPDHPVSEPTMTMLGSVGGSSLGRLSGQRLENPLLRSGLALAGANSWLSGEALPAPAEDGILNGEDVTGLDLLDTELVVLSACETGLGDVRVGEGVIGLRRAFVTAGARTLIMSLWKVPDYQTQDLMREFYESLLAGRPRADALRDAQLAMKSLYPNPHYWGAFICQGDPGPLS